MACTTKLIKIHLSTLSQCKVHYNDKSPKYSISYTTKVKAMEGKPLTVWGFLMPLEAIQKFNHFLLSKRSHLPVLPTQLT